MISKSTTPTHNNNDDQNGSDFWKTLDTYSIHKRGAIWSVGYLSINTAPLLLTFQYLPWTFVINYS